MVELWLILLILIAIRKYCFSPFHISFEPIRSECSWKKGTLLAILMVVPKWATDYIKWQQFCKNDHRTMFVTGKNGNQFYRSPSTRNIYSLFHCSIHRCFFEMVLFFVGFITNRQTRTFSASVKKIRSITTRTISFVHRVDGPWNETKPKYGLNVYICYHMNEPKKILSNSSTCFHSFHSISAYLLSNLYIVNEIMEIYLFTKCKAQTKFNKKKENTLERNLGD